MKGITVCWCCLLIGQQRHLSWSRLIRGCSHGDSAGVRKEPVLDGTARRQSLSGLSPEQIRKIRAMLCGKPETGYGDDLKREL